MVCEFVERPRRANSSELCQGLAIFKLSFHSSDGLRSSSKMFGFGLLGWEWKQPTNRDNFDLAESENRDDNFQFMDNYEGGFPVSISMHFNI